ncbi:hypothetical protein CAPTEDRAFT_17942 [Capitella teleta]|uniref:BolA-like protein 2 n=1 Tax=Capitella teleta TaxID=283909 RepID=R7UDQ5_CAPTE|nr:hypothetical protein CAPTEDRAFT_17942 [Capitella teleta]|eukprot:ELU04119.1 hypothetical protein CAPTEDRAFT_17942 [Capitella teleta]
MPYTPAELEEKLRTGLDATHVKIEDLSDGCGAKFSCLTVSSQFEGKALLQRHRLVNGILAEELKTIHAFSQKTLTPQQWESLKQESS